MSKVEVPEGFPDLTPTQQLVLAMRETVEEFEKTGEFTRAEALYLAATQFTQNPGPAPHPE